MNDTTNRQSQLNNITRLQYVEYFVSKKVHLTFCQMKLCFTKIIHNLFKHFAFKSN